MVNYQKERVKLTNTLLKKLKSAAKKNKRATLRLNMKKFEDEELPYQLFITTRPQIKICNTIANDMSADIKLSKDQKLKLFQESVTLL